MGTVSITPASAATNEARDLIARLDAYQSELYPAESNHLLPIDGLCQPEVTFLVARVDEVVAGCGAFVHCGDYAELKRMYVLPEFRGLKLGRRILAELEAHIRAAGLTVARLETGIAQPEALGLYERSGYVRCAPFGGYADDPLSVFMEKRLV